jgi:hypothetical protein
MFSLRTLFEKLVPKPLSLNGHQSRNGNHVTPYAPNGTSQAEAMRDEPFSFRGLVVAFVATLIVGVGGRGILVMRSAWAATRRLGHRCVQVVAIDVWRNEMDQPLDDCEPLPEASKVVLPPLRPCEYVEQVRNDPDWAPLRERIDPQRLVGKAESTSDGGGSDPGVGMTVAIAGESFVRSKVAAVLQSLAQARGSSGVVRPKDLLVILIASEAGAIGITLWSYLMYVIRHLLRGERVKVIGFVVLSSERPTSSRAQARGKRHALLAKVLPRALAAEAPFVSQEGPGGTHWAWEGPPIDYPIVVDSLCVHAQESIARERLGMTVALLTTPIGSEFLGQLRNDIAGMRESKRPLASCGVTIVAHHRDLLVQTVAALYARCLTAQPLEDATHGQAAGLHAWSEIKRHTIGDSAQPDAVGLLQRVTGKNLLHTASLALNETAKAFALPDQARTGAHTHFERLQRRFCTEVRNIVTNIEAEARQQLQTRVSQSLWQQVQARAQEAIAQGRPGEALSLLFHARAWVESAIQQLNVTSNADSGDAVTGSRQSFESAETSPCPTPAVLSDDTPVLSPAQSLIAVLWRKVVIWFLGNDDEDNAGEDSGSLGEINPQVRHWRFTIVDAAATWIPQEIRTRLCHGLAKALSDLNTQFQSLADETTAHITALRGADAIQQRQLLEVEAAIQQEAAACDLFLPAQEEVVEFCTQQVLAEGQLQHDLNTSLEHAAQAAGLPVTRLSAGQCAAAISQVAAARAQSARLEMTELLNMLPRSVVAKAAAVLRDTPVFVNLKPHVYGDPLVRDQLTIWAPAGTGEMIIHDLPSDCTIKTSPVDYLVGFRSVHYLRWIDFAEAQACLTAHNEAKPRRNLYCDERDLAFDDQAVTDDKIDALLVKASAAGFLLWDRGFRFVPENVELAAVVSERRQQTEELAPSLKALRDRLKRNEAPADIQAWQGRIDRLIATIGQLSFQQRMAETLAQRRLHQGLRESARRLLSASPATPGATTCSIGRDA